jgi:hypothetical protein
MVDTQDRTRERGRDVRGAVPSIRSSRDLLPTRQTRTCVRCGRHTTFVLEDPAGWYACAECGRYA